MGLNSLPHLEGLDPGHQLRALFETIHEIPRHRLEEEEVHFAIKALRRASEVTFYRFDRLD